MTSSTTEVLLFESAKPPELHQALGAAASAIATAEFYRQLMRAIGSMLRADLSMVMRYSRHSAPEYAVHDGLSPHDMEIYLRGLYRVDPVYRLCREHSARGVYNLDDICTPEERAGEYFSIFLQLTGMADDLVILFPAPAESTLGLVYERKEAFTRQDVDELREIYPLLEGMHIAHERLMLPQLTEQAREPGKPPVNYRQALDNFLEEKLTPRERDIVRLILLGFPTIKIAERLDLSVNTIKNHKKRIYYKLDITTERELFMSFVSYLFRDG